MARADLRHRGLQARDSFEKHLDSSTTVLQSFQARLDDPCVVEYEKVSGLDEFDKIRKAAVAQGRSSTIEKTAGAALGQGILGDERRGQVIVKVGKPHRRILNSKKRAS
jgi:hypothetical protein